MTAARALLTLSLAALLAGCGNPVATAVVPVPAAHVASVTTPRPATPAPAPAATAAPTPVPTPPPPVPAAVPAPPGGPPEIVVSQTDGPATVVSVLGPTGRTLATASAAVGSPWEIRGGPGGAYWEAGGRLHRLSAGGVLTDLGAMPAGASFAVSPDGAAVAYATSADSPSAHDMVNRLYVLRGGVSRLIASRPASTDGPVADAPAFWVYRLAGWTPAGILIAREPSNVCGCGAFGMEYMDAHTALVDPATGIAAALPTSQTCPLSGMGPGEVACFHITTGAEGGAIDALHIARAGAPLDVLALSGTSVAGDAVFSTDGRRLAYATAPAKLDCGAWESQTTLRVLDLATGTAHPVGGLGLEPRAWLADGRILATQAVGTTGIRVVLVDPARGTVTTLRSLASTAVITRLATA